MKKNIVVFIYRVFLLVLSISYTVLAQLFEVDTGFSAYFPGTPYLLETFDTDFGALKMYAYEDDDNLIVFTGSSVILKIKLLPGARNEFLKNAMIGHLKSVNGKLIRSRYIKFKGDYAITFMFKYIHSGYSITKMSIIICKESALYLWSVQEIDGYSTTSAKRVFEKYVGYIITK